MALTKNGLFELQEKTRVIRRSILDIAFKTQTHHLGSALSCVELLVSLYFHALKISTKDSKNTNRDRFILSKGHAALTLYVTLAEGGFFPKELLSEYSADGGRLGIHPDRECVPGVEVSSGSLGHGLSMASGLALAAKKDGLLSRCVVLLGDGECNEGTVWESALFAGFQRLDNLIAIIDYNRMQAFGSTDEVLNLDPLGKKFEAFGWGVEEIDGHNLDAITSALDSLPFQKGKPSVIVARTIKGKGFSLLENSMESHYLLLTEEQYRRCLEELEA